jgi:hypothetical protein
MGVGRITPEGYTCIQLLTTITRYLHIRMCRGGSLLGPTGATAKTKKITTYFCLANLHSCSWPHQSTI